MEVPSSLPLSLDTGTENPRPVELPMSVSLADLQSSHLLVHFVFVCWHYMCMRY